MSFDVNTLRKICREQAVARIVVADVRGSAPRGPGTAMLVTEDRCDGTIGGGTLEFEAIRKAREHLAKGALAPLIEQVPLGAKLGQCCGGWVTLAIEFFEMGWDGGEAPYILRNLLGANKPLAIKRAERAWRSGQDVPEFVFADGWIAEAVARPGPPLWLYGAGHVGRAIVDCLEGLGFDLVWVDTGEERFPQPLPESALVATEPAEVVRFAPPEAHHLVVTYSHAIDFALCHRILSQPHASLGLIGSATKRARFEKSLRELGHGEVALAGMTCPIGDPRLGKAPKAIAIGVVAEVIARVESRDSGAYSGLSTKG